MELELNNCLELSDEQFRKLPSSQKLDVLYVNVRAIAGIKRIQKMQWYLFGAMGTALGFIALELFLHLKGG